MASPIFSDNAWKPQAFDASTHIDKNKIIIYEQCLACDAGHPANPSATIPAIRDNLSVTCVF